ncbi:hypothetical protein DV735_g152, partial [Chaetothyriales sp. CBS 134920]
MATTSTSTTTIRRKPVPSPLVLSDDSSSRLNSGSAASPSSPPPAYDSVQPARRSGPRSLTVSGRNGRDINGSKERDINGSKERDINGSKARDINGSKARDINGSKERDINGSKDRGIPVYQSGRVQPVKTDEDTLSPAGSSRTRSEALGSAFKQAFGEARYIAGGLVAHPHESNKHYSIQRHSHSLVYYSGHYTSLELTVYADQPLPADRTYWLQRKGFSGHSGLAIGAWRGAHGSWVNVTPAVQASPDQIKPGDERAYQRDIARFLQRATKQTRNHVPRETCILRIPCEAQDGYLRVVLCAGEGGKKTLCSSPVFRLFSTSTDSSTIRGASLRTLPLEMGIKVGSMIANTAARSAATATAAPLVSSVSSAKQYVGGQVTGVLQPTFLQQEAATMLYDQAVTSATDKVGELEGQAEEARESRYQVVDPVTGDLVSPLQPAVVGDDSGPAPPFPVRFHGTVVRGRTGLTGHELGIPTADLAYVDSDITLRYRGVYLGWAAISRPKATTKTTKRDDDEIILDDEWHEALIYIAPRHIDASAGKAQGVVEKKTVQVQILHDFEGATFFDARVSLIMMALLRPVSPQHEERLEKRQAALTRDAACAAASLARPEWTADAVLSRINEAKSSRSMSERYVGLREGAQKSIDKVPLHKLGVRTDGHQMRDRLIGNGGVWIKR